MSLWMIVAGIWGLILFELWDLRQMHRRRDARLEKIEETLRGLDRTARFVGGPFDGDQVDDVESPAPGRITLAGEYGNEYYYRADIAGGRWWRDVDGAPLYYHVAKGDEWIDSE